jgi:hypothetical protein
MLAGDSDILQSHPKLEFTFDKYRYEIKSSASNSIYTLTDGTRTLTASLLFKCGRCNGRNVPHPW